MFIRRIATGFLAALLPAFALVTGRICRAEDRPNIVFVLADDWSWPHAGVYGDRTIRTPNFDRVAHDGMLFNYCFSEAPSCTPSRAAMLTGQYPHRLEAGADLWSFLPKKYPVYPDLLEKAGYHIGLWGKGWGPGDFKVGGYTQNPAGKAYKDFPEFLQSVPAGRPFCFWFGSHDPHRPYQVGEGAAHGLRIDSVRVPPMWPDVPEVRGDIMDYYDRSMRFDSQLGEVLASLEKAGKLQNTIVLVSGDNGWPFPRGKCNLYDAGTRQPLAVMWPARIKPGQVCDDFINMMDFAPTFLDAAGLKPPGEMTGRSFLGLLTGAENPGSRKTVFVERERHANVRRGDIGYPMRAVRTREFLYVRNLKPDRWPAGDPQRWVSVGPFGDCDPGPTKDFILNHRDDPKYASFFELSFAKRPAEELFDVAKDPDDLHNVADVPADAGHLADMRKLLDDWMQQTADPMINDGDDPFDRYPYFGNDGVKKKALP
jgi:N-sulfoglucosamine sulfohydrolase